MYQTIEGILGGEWWPAESPWESRRDAMLDVLGKATPYVFTPALQIDPVDGRLLIEALSGRWSYEKEARRDRRNIWFHVANAFSLLIVRMVLEQQTRDIKPIKVNTQFDPRRVNGDY
jgi:hypothetical protein